MTTARSLFDALGFHWDRRQVPQDVPVRTPERAIWLYQRERPGFVWDAAVLEGNPFTYPEVQTLMSGVTVGGRKIGDERHVANLAEAANELLRRAQERTFQLDKPTSDRFNWLVARDEAPESGHFRGEGSLTLTTGENLGQHGRHLPPSTEPGGANLVELHRAGLDGLAEHAAGPYEAALAYFLFAALNQFYFDGNKRTGRFMMNGWLLVNGYDAISVPAARREEFNRVMVDFFRFKDGTAMFAFLTSCLPDVGD